MNSEELTQELNKRNITIETIEEYIKFEDECVEKGFTFKSLLEAREKQIAKKVIIPSTDLGRYYHQESCPNCKKEFSVRICGYKFKDVIGKTNYCHNCGQKIDWSEVDE